MRYNLITFEIFQGTSMDKNQSDTLPMNHNLGLKLSRYKNKGDSVIFCTLNVHIPTKHFGHYVAEMSC
jgi:hypothetical protein